MDNEIELVLRESFKVILGDQYRDDLDLRTLIGMSENRFTILNRIAYFAKYIIDFDDLHLKHAIAGRKVREENLKDALACLPNAKDDRAGVTP
jgi:hypothetical protein